MNVYVYLLVAVGSIGVVLGIAAIACEWVPPHMRGHVVRPRMWGAGFTLLGGYIGSLGFALHGRGAASWPLWVFCAVDLLVAQALLRLSSRPGRPDSSDSP